MHFILPDTLVRELFGIPSSSGAVRLYKCVFTPSFRGYYPEGGGEVQVTVNPIKQLSPITMTERGTITKIYGRSFVAGVLPYKVTLMLMLQPIM